MGLKKKVQYPELSENEKKLQEKAATGTLEEVKALLQEQDVKVDCLDESGMTPLQHAAFRNKVETAELLLAHGADVNSNMHENGYTALMFAALSGNTEMTRLMLKHGAKKDRINSVKRNAAQMAAFVGQHQCVAVINNYYDKSDLEYFTKPQGQEKEPKLPPMLLPAVLTLLNMSNLHPVKVSFFLQEREEVMKESYKVCKVLDIICEKAMKSRDTDDVMAMKAHYFATVIRKVKDCDSLDKWIKRLVKGRDTDGYPEMQDQLIRQSLKEFPYVESILLQNMVRQLSQTKIGDNPTSLNILMQGVNGQKFSFDEDTDCTTCAEPNAKKCAKCKMVCYCNQRCQKLHWPTHKKFCASLAEQYKVIQKQKEKEAKEAAAEKLAQEKAKAESETAKNGEDRQTNGDGKQSSCGEKSQVPATEKQTTTAGKYTNTEEKSQTSLEENLEHLNVEKATEEREGAKSEGGEEQAIPDIDKLLADPVISKALQDKDIEKAVKEIKANPLSIKNYADSDKLRQLVERITGQVVPDAGKEGTTSQSAESQNTS